MSVAVAEEVVSAEQRSPQAADKSIKLQISFTVLCETLQEKVCSLQQLIYREGLCPIHTSANSKHWIRPSLCQ